MDTGQAYNNVLEKGCRYQETRMSKPRDFTSQSLMLGLECIDREFRMV